MTVRDGPGGRFGSLALLVVATVFAGAVAGAIGAAVQSSSAREALRSEIAERDLALATELAIRLDARVRNQIELLEVVADRRQIASLGEGATADLRSALGVGNALDELFLYDAEGRPVAAAASGYLASPADLPERPELAQTPRSVRITDDTPPLLEVTVAVEDPPGSPHGALVGRLPLDVAARTVLRVDEISTATRFVVDGDGAVVVHPDRERVLERRPVDLGDLLGPTAGVTEIDLDGTPHVVAAAPLELLDAYAMIAEERDAALAPVADQLRELTAILVAVIAAMVVAVIAAAAWLLAPLRPLVTAVRSLGHQELGVRVEQRGVGEVAAVAAEFNRLAEVLDDRQSQVLELQRLSILIGTQSSREDVATEAADGATRLTDATWVAFCDTGDDSPPAVRVARGTVDGAEALEASSAARRSGRTHRIDLPERSVVAIPIRTVDGAVDAVLVLAREGDPLSDDDVAVLEVYAAFGGVALDNVTRLRMQQELASELASAVEHRRQLLGSVSHELRTPLACIDGFSAILAERWDHLDDDERRDLVDRIGQHSRELDVLISQLLDFALVERGALDAALGPVALATVVGDVLRAAGPLLEGRSTTVDVPEVVVHADPVMLRRALSNLLSNAVKYSPAGSPVEVRAVPDGVHVRLEVTDHGVGLTADEAAGAFTPFWRSNRPETRDVRGAGVGLALVAEYARAMGGNVGVVSEPGHGSTFFVVLRTESGAAG